MQDFMQRSRAGRIMKLHGDIVVFSVSFVFSCPKKFKNLFAFLTDEEH